MVSSPSQLPRPTNPWDGRLGWFWYNDEEIFHDKDSDLARKAKAMVDTGVNLVATFSCTHFRWSFLPYWSQLNEVLSRIVNAFHEYDIQVVEHHSAVLTHGAKGKEGLDWFQHCLRIRHSDIASWPDWVGTPETRDPVIIDGQPLSSFYQVRGETGEIMDAGYCGYQICVNNPYYLRAYLAYLETIYATGVDGIMTDDVSYSWHGCVCEHCRRKFKATTGYDMPAVGGDWEAWLGSEKPAFHDFLDFKRKSVEDFHVTIKKHYENLGLRLIRPNYHAHCFHNYRSAYCLQKHPALDYVFQEAGGAHIMEYSWPSWGPEIAHRFSVGRFRRIPSMLMTYPTRESNLMLGWALAMSWGQGFTWTTEGFEPPRGEKTLRDFEFKHERLLQRPEKIARIGFYDSHRAREMNLGYKENVHRQLMCWLMSCGMSNIPYDVFSTEELSDRLPTYDVIVLIGVAYLSSWELSELKYFLAGGGIMVWTGDTGRFDCSRTIRCAEDIVQALDCPSFAFPEPDDPIESRVAGNGRLLTCGRHYLVADYEPEYRIDWWSQEITKEASTPFKHLTDRDLQIRSKIVALLEENLTGGPDLSARNLPDGVLATIFLSHDRAALVIHLVNASGIFDKDDGAPLTYYDENSVPFPSHSDKEPITLIARIPRNSAFEEAGCLRGFYHSPDCHVAVELPVKSKNGNLHVTIRPDLLKAYALIEIRSC